MNSHTRFNFTCLAFSLLVIGAVATQPVVAQNTELQQKVADLKQIAAANKQALAQYTYVQTTTVSLNGEVKKVTHDQVVTGPDGTPQKTSLDPPPPPPSGGRLRQHVVAKKTDEFEDYANSIKALIAQYMPPNSGLIEQAASSGNIMMGPAGAPGESKLVISNYVKQGDNMTVTVNRAAGGMQSISIATYLTSPSDAVTVNVQFSRIPGGPSYPAMQTINGTSKKMTIVIQNANYQHV